MNKTSTGWSKGWAVFLGTGSGTIAWFLMLVSIRVLFPHSTVYEELALMAFLAFVGLVLLGISVALAIYWQGVLRACRSELQTWRQLRDEFFRGVGLGKIQDAVQMRLEAAGFGALRAHELVIRFQQGGLKAVNESPALECDVAPTFEKVRDFLSARFRDEADNFYRLYDLAVSLNNLGIRCYPGGKRHFEVYAQMFGDRNAQERAQAALMTEAEAKARLKAVPSADEKFHYPND